MELDLNVGEVLEIITEQEPYRTKVKYKNGENEIVIDVPLSAEGSFLLLRAGDHIELDALRKDEKGRIFYLHFKSTVIERIKRTENQPLLKLKIYGVAQKVQRRKFFRINYDKEISIFLGNVTSSFDYDSSKAFVGNIIDISAGGVRFLSDKKIPENAKMVLDFQMLELHIKTEAICIFTSKDKETKKYDVRVKFLRLGENIETDLVRVIGKIQSEQIKNSNNRIYEMSREKVSLKSTGINYSISEEKKDAIIQPLQLIVIIITCISVLSYLMAYPKNKEYMIDGILNIDRPHSILDESKIIFSKNISIINLVISYIAWRFVKKMRKKSSILFILTGIIAILMLILSIMI